MASRPPAPWPPTAKLASGFSAAVAHVFPAGKSPLDFPRLEKRAAAVTRSCCRPVMAGPHTLVNRVGGSAGTRLSCWQFCSARNLDQRVNPGPLCRRHSGGRGFGTPPGPYDSNASSLKSSRRRESNAPCVPLRRPSGGRPNVGLTLSASPLCQGQHLAQLAAGIRSQTTR
jgi:hypothetical protein